jgi:hypothetical protein
MLKTWGSRFNVQPKVDMIVKEIKVVTRNEHIRVAPWLLAFRYTLIYIPK